MQMSKEQVSEVIANSPPEVKKLFGKFLDSLDKLAVEGDEDKAKASILILAMIYKTMELGARKWSSGTKH